MAPENRTKVKFCGFTRAGDVTAAVEAGADYLGFNFFPKSPRAISPETAGQFAEHVPDGVTKVALVVNGEDSLFDAIVSTARPDMLQLHGSESPGRVSELKARYDLPVMKVIGVSEAADLSRIAEYGSVADRLLVDAKPPKGADLPGGNGVAFDWRLIAGVDWPVPWMLAGGLVAANVVEAVQLTDAPAVDLASGVESAPGEKDAALMAEFVRALTDA